MFFVKWNKIIANYCVFLNILVDLRPLMAGNVSGVETYIKNLLEQLFKIDSENHYILWWNSHDEVSQNIPRFKNDNITYISTKVPNKFLNLSLSFFRFPKIDKWVGKKLGIKIDRIFVPDPRLTPVSKDCKKIMTIHDLSFEHYKEAFSITTRLWHKVLKPKKEAKEAGKIIAVSESTKQDLERTYCLDEEKVKVVYEASSLQTSVETPKLGVSTEVLRKKYELPEKFILTLSTIEPRKNIEGLLQAFQRLKAETNLPHKLVIAGRRNDKIFGKVNMLNPNEDDIIFTGFVEEKDKACLYSLAEAFVYPSFFEGFGLPLVEAMQMGAPVITSNLSVMPEIVREAGYFVDPYDIDSVKEGMKVVLEDDNLREQMRKKGIERSKDFSWEKCAKETLEILNSKL